MLRIGDRVQIAGGYDAKPQWLGGGTGYLATVMEFFWVANIKDKNEAALVQLEGPLTSGAVTSSLAMLTLRYADAKWADSETCHVTLCTEKPSEGKWWEDTKRFAWVESHATYRKVGT